MRSVVLPPFTRASFSLASPASGLTLQLDLDASISGSVTAPGTAVSQWVDQSPNGYVFTQATGANKPVYPGTTQNGLNTMLFGSGGDTWLDNSGIPIPQRMLMFAVYANAISGASLTLLDEVTGPNANRVGFLGDNASQHAAGFAATALACTTNLGTTFHVICVDYNGVSSAIYVNGTQEATGTVGLNNMTTLRVGSSLFAITGFQGLLAELKIYTGGITSDIATITTQLRTKWGI